MLEFNHHEHLCTFLAALIDPCTGRDTNFIFSKNDGIMIVQDGGSSV